MKAYVALDDVFVFRRPSLSTEETNSSVSFDSQTKFVASEGPVEELIDAGDKQLAELVRRQLSDALQMTLFGFDIVRDLNTYRAAIVDINYFPGYKELCVSQSLAHLLVRHALMVVNHTRR